MSKRLLLGDEAVALGAIHAGLGGVYAYPGTPSTEITEFIQKDPLALSRGIHSRWCTNEKTAMEAALGMSYAGRRALVCMKHVGMNVCADAFVNSALTGVNGGVVVLAADDPSMHSSQNEQDSRFYGQFALVPVFEPSTQQEAYDMIGEAFEFSEANKVPVLFRVVTRLAHSRAAVVLREAAAVEPKPVASDKGWILLPAIARRQYAALLEKQPAFEAASEAAAKLEGAGTAAEAAGATGAAGAAGKARIGIVACGIAYNYVREALCEARAETPVDSAIPAIPETPADSASPASPETPAGTPAILKINRYPLPEAAIRELAAGSDSIMVFEDGQPFAEQGIRAILGAGYPVKGRLTGNLPRTGELTPDNVAKALGCPEPKTLKASEIPAPRPPQLCQGCGHRDVFTALNEVAADYPGARIFGDIGCYTLGALPPFKSLSSCVDMGASITMAKGAADAGVFPSIAVIGDSTFTHSGMTGLLDAVNDSSNITVIISDNLTTAMTGGQDSAGTSKYEAICTALGVAPEHVRVVVPTKPNLPEITRIIREEIEYPGVSVIIPRRECMQTLRRKNK